MVVTVLLLLSQCQCCPCCFCCQLLVLQRECCSPLGLLWVFCLEFTLGLLPGFWCCLNTATVAVTALAASTFTAAVFTRLITASRVGPSRSAAWWRLPVAVLLNCTKCNSQSLESRACSAAGFIVRLGLWASRPGADAARPKTLCIVLGVTSYLEIVSSKILIPQTPKPEALRVRKPST